MKNWVENGQSESANTRPARGRAWATTSKVAATRRRASAAVIAIVVGPRVCLPQGWCARVCPSSGGNCASSGMRGNRVRPLPNASDACHGGRGADDDQERASRSQAARVACEPRRAEARSCVVLCRTVSGVHVHLQLGPCEPGWYSVVTTLCAGHCAIVIQRIRRRCAIRTSMCTDDGGRSAAATLSAVRWTGRICDWSRRHLDGGRPRPPRRAGRRPRGGPGRVPRGLSEGRAREASVGYRYSFRSTFDVR